MFRARLVDNSFKPGPESSAVELFSEGEIPWDEIAFSVIIKTLRKFYKDRLTGEFPFYIGDVLHKI
jgi:hypothetical protein